jgi:hypothetical protein
MKSLLLLVFTLGSLMGQASQMWTISGISSGGFMAEQMAVAYSSQFSGVATVAGGYYFCAGTHFEKQQRLYGTSTLISYKTNTPSLIKSFLNPFSSFFMNVEEWVTPSFSNPLYRALTVCLNNPNLSLLPRQILGVTYFDTYDLADKGLIDPIENLSKQKVLIYQGKSDSVVNPSMASQLKNFRTHFKASEIKEIYGVGAHNFPSKSKKAIDCQSQKPPYVGNCDLDLAGEILEFLAPKSNGRVTGEVKVYTVSQETSSLPDSIAQYGYVVSSDLCLKFPDRCHMHVALHGCQMTDYFDPDFHKAFENNVVVRGVNFKPDNSKRAMGMWLRQFIELAGWKEAIKNKPLMVVFPQTYISEKNYPFNPSGCWDWYGWTGSGYSTKQGQETAWLMGFLSQFSKNPTMYLLEDVTR